jgi:hypothetical protein
MALGRPRNLRATSTRVTTDLAFGIRVPHNAGMRSSKRFAKDPTKPKRTHDERRLATLPSLQPWPQCLRVSDAEYAKRITIAIAMADARANSKRASMWPYLKRALYLAVYHEECRRGKWRARAERGKQKRSARWSAKRFGVFRYQGKAGAIERSDAFTAESRHYTSMHKDALDPITYPHTWLAPLGFAIQEARRTQ